MFEIKHKDTGEVLLRMEGGTLAGAYLAGAQLAGASLRRADLSRAELQGADLTGADLAGAKLHRADLGGAFLTRASLRAANLVEASLRGACCTQTNMTRANLRCADLTGTDLEAVSLHGADCSLARLIGVNLSRADLRKANLCGTDLSGANLTAANLSRALYGGAVRGATAYPSLTYRADRDYTRWEDGQPGRIDPLHRGARKVGWLRRHWQAAAERIRWALWSTRHARSGGPGAGGNEPKLVIKAGSLEEMHTILGLAEELIDYMGGSADDRYDSLQVVFEVPRASNDELHEVWQRVVAGEAPGAAYHAVKGPSYRFRERLRRELRDKPRASPSNQRIEIKHRSTGEVLHRVEGDTLTGAYLAGAELSGVSLAGADLSTADLQGSRLVGAELAGGVLRRADLRGAWLWHANLRGADLEAARLQGAFSFDASLPEANLCRADLAGAVLSHADLRGADLTGANLAGADLANADLRGANLTQANLVGAHLYDATYDEHTLFPGGLDPLKRRMKRIGGFFSECVPEAIPLDEAMANEIAKRAVAANSGRPNCIQYAYAAKRDGDGWRVTADPFRDYGPDGSPNFFLSGRCWIEIDGSGRVIRFIVSY